MADVNKSIEISYKADLKDLLKNLKKIPNMTKEEAQKMVGVLRTELNKSTRAAEKAARAHKKEFKKIEKSAQRAEKAIFGMNKATVGNIKNIGIAAGAAAVGLGFFVQEIADMSNQLVDASTATGISVEILGGLRIAAEGAGLQFENLERSLIKLPKTMKDAQAGSKRAQRAFLDLGISVDELGDSNEVFLKIASSLSKVESAEKKAAAAAELFGVKGGADFVKSGALDNLQAFIDLSNEFGVDKGPKMQKTMADFQRISATAMEAVKGSVLDLLDALTGDTDGQGLNTIMIEATASFIFFSEVASKAFNFVADRYKAIFSTITEFDLSKPFKSLFEVGKEINPLVNFDKLVTGVFSMGDALEEATQKANRFKATLRKTLSGGTGGGGGDGQGETTEEKRLKDAQKVSMQLERNIDQLWNSLVSISDKVDQTDISFSSGFEKIEQQSRLKISLIEREITAIDSLIDTLKEQATTEDHLAKLDEASMIANEKQSLLKIQQQQIEKQAAIDMADLRSKLAKEEFDRIEQIKVKNEEGQKRLERTKIQAIENSGAIASQYLQVATSTAELLETLDGETRSARIRNFHIGQAVAMSEIAINTAVAITKALASGLGVLEIAPIAATGAIQMATVAAQKPPTMHTGGMIAGSSDEVRITALKGEAVLNKQAVNNIGEAGVKKLNRGGTLDNVVVLSPFKHYDRYLSLNARKGGFLSSLSNQKANRGY